MVTTTGRKFNHKYGFGHIDAYKAIEKAKNWKLVGNHTTWRSPVKAVHENIGTDGGQSNNHIVNSTINVNETHLSSVNMSRLEHVTVTVDIIHKKRGDIMIELISPNNVISLLATERRDDMNDSGMLNWTLMTVKHWNEFPIVGNWTLRVSDANNNEYNGIFRSWSMKLWGEIAGPVSAAESSPRTFLHSFIFTLAGYLTLVAIAVTICQLLWRYLLNAGTKSYKPITPSEMIQVDNSLENLTTQILDDENDENDE